MKNLLRKLFGVRKPVQKNDLKNKKNDLPKAKKDDLRSRVALAKKVVEYDIDMLGNRDVSNYDQIRDILQYADTLGMRLFVRDWIANELVSVDACVDFLKNVSND